MTLLGPRLTALALAPAALLFAGAFWSEGSPESWTADQMEELLSDSPWAKPAEVRFLGDRGGSGLPGGVGLPSGRGGRTGGGTRVPGGGGWPGAGGGIGFPYVNHARGTGAEADATVVWTSALPVRKALERLGLMDELRDVHAQDFYIVTIDGLPAAMAPLAETPDAFRQSARLEIKNGTAIRAARVEVRPRPGAPAIELYFPREEIVTADDKTMELQIAAGGYAIRCKFKLADMIYRGLLEM